MWRSVWRVWFEMYEGALVMSLRIFDWNTCIFCVFDLLAVPQSSSKILIVFYKRRRIEILKRWQVADGIPTDARELYQYRKMFISSQSSVDRDVEIFILQTAPPLRFERYFTVRVYCAGKTKASTNSVISLRPSNLRNRS